MKLVPQKYPTGQSQSLVQLAPTPLLWQYLFVPSMSPKQAKQPEHVTPVQGLADDPLQRVTEGGGVVVVVVVVVVVLVVVVVVVVVVGATHWSLEQVCPLLQQNPLQQVFEQHCSFLLHFDWGRLPPGLHRRSAWAVGACLPGSPAVPVTAPTRRPASGRQPPDPASVLHR